MKLPVLMLVKEFLQSVADDILKGERRAVLLRNAAQLLIFSRLKDTLKRFICGLFGISARPSFVSSHHRTPNCTRMHPDGGKRIFFQNIGLTDLLQEIS